MQVENAIITSISTLLAVGITLFFTNRRENNKFMQELLLKEYLDMEEFYISLIASIEKGIAYTKAGQDYKDLADENSINSAKANLSSPRHINEKLASVSGILYDWSSFYWQSLPKKIGDSGLGMVSNHNYDSKAKADELFPKLRQEIGELIGLLKEDLRIQRKNLKGKPSR